MNIDQALKKIGEITEKALEKNPNALTWDDEINIKRSMVNSLNLENPYSNMRRHAKTNMSQRGKTNMGQRDTTNMSQRAKTNRSAWTQRAYCHSKGFRRRRRSSTGSIDGSIDGG